MSMEKIEELKKRMMEAHALSDDELEKVSGGFWDECETSGCEFFGHSHACIDQRQRGLCPYAYTW